jgi:hypothetical protein
MQTVTTVGLDIAKAVLDVPLLLRERADELIE